MRVPLPLAVGLCVPLELLLLLWAWGESLASEPAEPLLWGPGDAGW